MDGELLERIAKLEALIENVGEKSDEHGTTIRHMNSDPAVGMTKQSSQFAVSDRHPRAKGSSNGATSHQSSKPGSGLDRYMGTSFWMTLSEEINGLKEVLNGSSDEEDENEIGQTSTSSLSSLGQQRLPQSSDSRFVIAPMLDVESPGSPTPHQLYTFCDVYLKNVDPVFKILHAPSLRKFLQQGAADLDCSPGTRGLGALKFAICYAATMSMTDGECRHQIGEDRVVLMTRYRAGTEQSLANADFVNTVELSTLQAMTIYLVINFLQCSADWTFVDADR